MFSLLKENNFYRLLSLLGSNKTRYFTLLFLARITTMSQVIIFAWLLKIVLDRVSGVTNELFLPVIIMMILYFVLMVLDFYLYYVLAIHTNDITGQIRLRFIDHLIKLPLNYYDAQQSGEIISRLTNDIQSVVDAFTRKIINLNSTLTGGIFTIVAIFILDWRMGIYSVIVGFLFGIVNVFFAPRFRNVAEQLQQKLGSLTSTLSEMLSGIRTIKLFNLYDQQRHQYGKDNEDTYRLFVRQGKLGGTLDGLNLVLTYLSTVGILAIGLLLSFQGSISIGTVVAVLFLQSGVTSMFLFTGNFVSELQQSLVSTKRVFDVLDIEEEPLSFPACPGMTSCKEENMMIGLNNLQFSYQPHQPILNNLNLVVRKGERAALVGPSGSGKSTIFKILMGFYPVDTGNIVINRKAVYQQSLSEIRQLIAYVPQEPILFNVTIEENIRYGNLSASKQEIIEAAIKANAHAFIELLPNGYDTVLHEDSANLSGGQRQRIAIARAFIRNAEILLLDEATSALDSQSEKLVQDALDQLMEGRTTLVIAHRLSTIQTADKIFVLDKGEIVEQGSHEQLLKEDGLYSELTQIYYRND